jgi:hypothetical protein
MVHTGVEKQDGSVCPRTQNIDVGNLRLGAMNN